MTLAPFPYFGGKSRVAPLVWERFGDVANYLEPFAGSLAVLLARPHDCANRIETVNDVDGMIANFWRSTQAAPDLVAQWADWPVNENDLTARHLWLVGQKESLQHRLESDPDYYDAKIAGWWVWGICSWIGSGWCSGEGPWQVTDGELSKRPHLGDAGVGVNRQRPHLGTAGAGVNRKLPHLNRGKGVNRKLPHLRNAGVGVHRVSLSGATCQDSSEHLGAMMQALSDRLRRVRVCCGDWRRVCGPSPTYKHGLTGVFLDPPYSAEANRQMGLYTHDSGDVAHAAREWAIEQGENPLMRLAICGYEGEYTMPPDWEPVIWKAHGGYGLQGEGRGRENAGREVVWFSPHCLKPERPQQLSFLTEGERGE